MVSLRRDPNIAFCLCDEAVIDLNPGDGFIQWWQHCVPHFSGSEGRTMRTDKIASVMWWSWMASLSAVVTYQLWNAAY
jgi:hypothetical protein